MNFIGCFDVRRVRSWVSVQKISYVPICLRTWTSEFGTVQDSLFRTVICQDSVTGSRDPATHVEPSELSAVDTRSLVTWRGGTAASATGSSYRRCGSKDMPSMTFPETALTAKLPVSQATPNDRRLIRPAIAARQRFSSDRKGVTLEVIVLAGRGRQWLSL